MDGPAFNLVNCRPVDLRWAVANVLHFFAGTEEAAVLRKYNRHADRYLSPNGRLRGAYGAIAVPQIRRCIELLKAHPASRRAIVSMGELPEDPDINRPACWSFLHFLVQDGMLHMHVYQRSLNLCGVMPYDCILLSNIMFHVACAVKVGLGKLQWTVGSLHVDASVDVRTVIRERSIPTVGILLHAEVLSDPALCIQVLEDPNAFDMGIYTKWLKEPQGVVT